jgi:PAS domain S-box-containing protein
LKFRRGEGNFFTGADSKHSTGNDRKTDVSDYYALLSSLFNSTFEQSSIGQALFDLGGNLIRTNKKLSEIAGYSAEKLSDIYFNDHTRSLGADEGSPVYQILYLNQNTLQQQEMFTFRKDDGSEIALIVSTSKVYDHQDELSFYIKSFEDVSVLRHSEMQIRRMAQEFDHFVYRAFHDLQGPLASIEGICNLLKMEATAPESKDYADMIGQISVKMKKALMGMLEAAKINDLDRETATIDFEALIRNIRTDLEKTAGSDEVNILLDVPKNIIFRTDPAYLGIIIKHLLENAVIFRDTHKTQPFVKLHIEQTEQDHLHIRIEDNGIGINQEDQTEVFQMFCRKSARSRGAGIGLYLTKQSVERLGGSIRLESSPGRGTTVEVLL